MRKVLYILGQLDDLDVHWLSRAGRKRRLADGAAAVRQGEPNPSLYILLDGRLAVTVAGVGQVALLQPGEIVGEMSFVDSAPPSATVTAAGHAEVLELPKAELERKILADQGFGFRFYRALALFLADRLRTTQQQRAAGSGVSLAAREAQTDELDELLLDGVALAGERFDRLLGTLASAPAV